ncbi:hypothetical protein WA026_015277 [Henosepilachna vigintioctopunctata]|uniref:Uncharacterized protein n=1 Tax=Henosepilachna vigintioctopunctata TaxID=420089 RepID=A0AAW1TUC9_9CUCU
MKKYKSKSTTTKLDLKDSSSCATGNQCTASSSTFNIESTEPQPSVVQSFYPVNIISPDHSTIPEHTSIPELSKPLPSTSHENIIPLENLNLDESDVSMESNVGSGTANIICIFCDRKTKKHRNKRQPLHRTEKAKFLSSILQENDSSPDLLQKVENCAHSNIFYHHICQAHFTNKMKSNKKATKGIWHENRHNHQIAFSELSLFIKENLLLRIFRENKEDNEKVSSHFTPQHLEDKIIDSFSKEVKFFFIHNEKLLAPKYLISIDDQSFESLQDEDILQKAAFLLRKLVKHIPLKKLPENITLQNLKEGEVSVPQALSKFCFTLISGGNQIRKKERKCIRQVQSCYYNQVYNLKKFKSKNYNPAFSIKERKNYSKYCKDVENISKLLRNSVNLNYSLMKRKKKMYLT